MDFSGALISRIEDLPGNVPDDSDFRYDLLDWIAESGLLKLSVFERELKVREKYYRFAISGETDAGAKYHGFGRSPDKKTAATIAVNEVLERFVSRAALAESKNLARLKVTAQSGEITVKDSVAGVQFPSPGLHSSNGWAVHFSARAAIENATREVLERHILLLSYLKHGWSGFFFDENVPFAGVTLTPGIAQIMVGGFKAGIVLTTGAEAPGATFGYLCAAGEEFEKSGKWLGAFFESYEQWMDLTPREQVSSESVIEQYQWHYLKSERPALSNEVAPESVIPQATGNLAVFDLQKALSCPFPLFAAFVFGGDFIPLFLRQKLSGAEATAIQSQLELLGITKRLPEIHPIL